MIKTIKTTITLLLLHTLLYTVEAQVAGNSPLPSSASILPTRSAHRTPSSTLRQSGVSSIPYNTINTAIVSTATAALNGSSNSDLTSDDLASTDFSALITLPTTSTRPISILSSTSLFTPVLPTQYSSGWSTATGTAVGTLKKTTSNSASTSAAAAILMTMAGCLAGFALVL